MLLLLMTPPRYFGLGVGGRDFFFRSYLASLEPKWLRPSI